MTKTTNQDQNQNAPTCRCAEGERCTCSGGCTCKRCACSSQCGK